jgi:hypothetical protein
VVVQRQSETNLSEIHATGDKPGLLPPASGEHQQHEQDYCEDRKNDHNLDQVETATMCPVGRNWRVPKVSLFVPRFNVARHPLEPLH